MSAVAFVFFPQEGLLVDLCQSEAATDRLTTPWLDRWAVKPYLLPSWSRPSSRRWDPLVQSDNIC
jgi:hypothetical protein